MMPMGGALTSVKYRRGRGSYRSQIKKSTWIFQVEVNASDEAHDPPRDMIPRFGEGLFPWRPGDDGAALFRLVRIRRAEIRFTRQAEHVREPDIA